MELKNIFKPGKIGTVEIKNRIVRSATLEGRADRGLVTQDLINFYKELAAGGSGLIITGGCSVDKSGSAGNAQTQIFNDKFIEGQKKLVDAVHEYDDTKIAIQLFHAGRQGFYPDHPPIAPSAIHNAFTKQTPKEATLEEIDYLIKCFIDAGKRAYECGYDLIQLHAAHGTFLNNFLSPYMNRRTDEFGGTIEKRSKILVDIYTQLKDEIGKDYPIFVKLQTLDGFSNGIDIEEAKKIAQILIKTGFAAIEPSGGSSETAFTGDKVSYSR
ncbi:MAG: NADH:flavin oxidoreductase, partial [Promethearchaeota archaeon]